MARIIQTPPPAPVGTQPAWPAQGIPPGDASPCSTHREYGATAIPSAIGKEITPIFVVGCQRSGSTLLGAMLGSGKRMIATPESQFVADLMPHDPRQIMELGRAIDAITAHPRFKLWNFSIGDLRPAGYGTFMDAVNWLVRTYGARSGRMDIDYWVEHQPGNVRHMRALAEACPDARFVHIVRDGRAVANSLLKVDWGPNSISSAAHFWSQRVAMGMALRDCLPHNRWARVRYEDLLAQPDEELRRICATLELPFDDAMIAARGYHVPPSTRKQHHLVGQALAPQRIDAWQQELSQRQVEIFEAHVGPLITYLGYQLSFGRSARLPSAAETARMIMVQLFQGYRNRLKLAINIGRARAERTAADNGSTAATAYPWRRGVLRRICQMASRLVVK